MAYTTYARQSGPGWTALRTVLTLAAGALLGLMISQVQIDGHVQDALSVGPIAGENWHGNVRNSTR